MTIRRAAPCTILVPLSTVSRRHARIVFDGATITSMYELRQRICGASERYGAAAADQIESFRGKGYRFTRPHCE